MKKLVIAIICFYAALSADTNFKVMSYNALNFAGSNTSRSNYFKSIIESNDPDIIVMQEIIDQAGANLLLNTFNQINGEYSASSFVDGADTDNMLYFKTTEFSLISQAQINTELRDISEYILSIDDNEFRIYSCHLKASDGSTNEQQRLQEILELRDHLESLPAGTEYLIVGDMNFYSSSESAYQNLTSTTPVISEDLCSDVGYWHNNSSYSDVHTQATSIEGYGGGASGGLDDKFDFILSSSNLNNNSGIEFSLNSFIALGNDGNHFNQSINNGTNYAVSSTIADALYEASDHLPVCADFISISSGGTQPSGDLIISEYIEGSGVNKAIEIYNGTGVSINLGSYMLEKDVNGNGIFGNTYDYSGILAHDDVFVLANSGADPAILAVANSTANGVINFNGNDQVRLLKNSNEIDRIGIPGDVAFGVNVTYVRKSTVTSPQSGSQDPRSNEEWDSYPSDTFSYLGSHTAINPTITISSPNGGEDWKSNSIQTITWTSADIGSEVKIELYKDTEDVYTTLIESTENDGGWDWQIPVDFAFATDYKIKISDVDDLLIFDESDNFFSITATSPVIDLFITEYVEGSSNNKAIEIFNGTGTPVDLSDYRLERCNNGTIWGAGVLFTFETDTWVIANNDVWVNANDAAIPGMQAQADSVGGELTYFNGDDSIGLFKSDGIGGWTLIDVIGENGIDPGTAWSVAGVSGATSEHTLVRKSTITSGNTNWSISAGTNTEDSEWIVLNQDNYENLGSHELNIIINPHPDPPQNFNIEILTDSNHIKLTWQNEGFTYNIYSSENSEAQFPGENWTLETSVQNTGTATISIAGSKKFYVVVADN